MSDLIQKIENMYLPKYRKQRPIAMKWLQEVLDDLQLRYPEEEVIVLPLQTDTTIYVRLKEIELNRRIEKEGFYKKRNWSNECIWGTPMEDLNGHDFWPLIKELLAYYMDRVQAA